MRSIVKTIEHGSRSDEFTIYLLSDVHLGARACDERLFQETIDKIARGTNTFWIGLGDFLDAIHRHDKRHREDTLADWLRGQGPIITLQRDRLIDMLKPIGHRCLAYLIGNHENSVEEDCSVDAYLDVINGIAPHADIRMGMSGFLTLRFQRCAEEDRKGGTWTLPMYLHHGAGGGEMMSGSALKLERMAETYSALVYAMGHTHRRVCFPSPVVYADRSGKIVAETRFYINTGSFLKSALPDAVTYPERFGKKPLALGCVQLLVRPGCEVKQEKVRVLL